MAKNKVLGRGLADIFPEINEVYEQGLYERANRVVELGIDEADAQSLPAQKGL